MGRQRRRWNLNEKFYNTMEVNVSLCGCVLYFPYHGYFLKVLCVGECYLEARENAWNNCLDSLDLATAFCLFTHGELSWLGLNASILLTKRRPPFINKCFFSILQQFLLMMRIRAYREYVCRTAAAFGVWAKLLWWRSKLTENFFRKIALFG